MIFITTPASKSHDIIDLMHMKGLQCGNESGGYNRRAHVDRLPEKCVEDVSVYKGAYLVFKCTKTFCSCICFFLKSFTWYSYKFDMIFTWNVLHCFVLQSTCKLHIKSYGGSTSRNNMTFCNINIMIMLYGAESTCIDFITNYYWNTHYPWLCNIW